MEPFPRHIARFIETNIESVDQLEILRILATDKDREWSTADLAQATQAQPQTIAKHLDALERRGLMTVTRGPSIGYRYGARISELENGMGHMLRLYNERPVSTIRMVYTKDNNALKSFADAFDIRPEE